MGNSPLISFSAADSHRGQINTFMLDINRSMSSEFVVLVPSAGVSFITFGNAIQRQLDDFNSLHFPGDASRIEFQDLWARHPNRQG